MKDELEDFVRQNREAFDDKEPSQKVWASVERSLFSKQSKIWYNSLTLWRAAATLFLALSIYLFIPKDAGSHQNDLVLKEFSDVESFYIKQISEKVQLIDDFERHEGLNGFTRDFQQLEAMYSVLKEEMKNHPSQKVKDALVLNLLVQIDLLNQQIHKLEKEYTPQEEEKVKANA